MSTYTEGASDEKWNSKWGASGNTAKLKAAQQCSDWNYYSHTIEGGGPKWVFWAKCYDKEFPEDWSKPFSNEAAREAGFTDRNKAAEQNCKARGFAGIDPGQWRDKGTWNFSLKCVKPGWIGEWVKEKCLNGGKKKMYRKVDARGANWEESATWLLEKEIGAIYNGKKVLTKKYERKIDGIYIVLETEDPECDVQWDNAVSGKDGNGSKITIKKCNNWVENDVKSCLESPTKPKDIKYWINCGIGSSPGGIAPGDSAGACSPISKNANDFTCVWGQNCFGVTDLDVNWDPPVKGVDGKGSKITIQKCNNWVNNDPNSCKNSPSKPSDIKYWINCGIGSSPGGIAPGDGAGACSPISKNADTFNCVGGQNCFAITDMDVNWKPPQSGCDRDGNIMTIQQCNNWINDDPSSCVASASKPNNIKHWIGCDVGSPLNSLGLCSKKSDNAKQTSCMLGQQCYAITNIKQDRKTCPRGLLTNPTGAIEDFFNNNRTMILIIIGSLILLSILSIAVKLL